MSLEIEPEVGIAISEKAPNLDLRTRVEAASNTAAMLSEHGLEVEPTAEDNDIAAKLTLAYADDPDKTSKKVSAKRASSLPPAALMATHGILTQFGHSVVESATQVRHLVTNKLIEETENPDPRVRIRALELLGKISDVGLFTEKAEVTITHKTTDELRESLRAKLAKIIEPEDAVIIDGDSIDVDEELGLTDG